MSLDGSLSPDVSEQCLCLDLSLSPDVSGWEFGAGHVWAVFVSERVRLGSIYVRTGVCPWTCLDGVCLRTAWLWMRPAGFVSGLVRVVFVSGPYLQYDQ